ncbi:PEP-CTERM sorting domain-containing protein [Aeoliella sp. ICT_H6.2]|uniref:PEP-CTERM sorting domain-containing protein n=1 Tax=Aeoliella straminimaris TaxID=2954799 RepID=A0A9X2F8A6_9BACT|nr:PEP-CTERM sorting domain-containing protein [Aeoliella straminimaris]MCO6044192.1 PEP-CTERM sorting domain-containing protein [Aeoliella straminimaris]
MIRHITLLGALAALLAVPSYSHATILGFGQIGGSNGTIPKDYGSNADADTNGVVVANGATPNIALTWDVDGENNNGDPNSNGWDIHTSSWFDEIENQSVGGGDWDNEGGSNRIAQLDFDYHSIGFAADPGYSLVLNSFDFGNTPETEDSSVWDLSLTDSSESVVWSEQVTLTNPDTDVLTVTPNFTGNPGESYTLVFAGVNDPLNGRHAIDNLSFNQVGVPEPATVSLIVLGALMGLGVYRRR